MKSVGLLVAIMKKYNHQCTNVYCLNCFQFVGVYRSFSSLYLTLFPVSQHNAVSLEDSFVRVLYYFNKKKNHKREQCSCSAVPLFEGTPGWKHNLTAASIYKTSLDSGPTEIGQDGVCSCLISGQPLPIQNNSWCTHGFVYLQNIPHILRDKRYVFTNTIQQVRGPQPLVEGPVPVHRQWWVVTSNLYLVTFTKIRFFK